ncbi:MAG: hypothetical protein ACP5J1_02835 [Fervidicoccaceae archaeon]
MSPGSSLCVVCKGTKKLCGLEECPILLRTKSMFRIFYSVTRKPEVFGMTPPSSVVGEKGYPNVPVLYNIAPGGSEEKASLYEDPKAWQGRLGLKEIVEMRTSLLGGILKVPATDPWKLYEGEVSLALVSTKPVDSEVLLKRPPTLELTFDDIVRPSGLVSPLEKIRISSSPKIDRDIEKFIWEDLLARDAVVELYSRGKDVYLIERALSLGLLGLRKNRKLVPTRWAITAVDDAISNYLRKEVMRYEDISTIEIYRGEYLYNRFFVMLVPGTYEGYWVEVWYPRSIWASNSVEPEIGVAREKVSGEIVPPDGGFSAARLAVLEHLRRIKRRAKYIIVREVLPEYAVPVGNWHIRETVRTALLSKPFVARDYREASDFMESNLSSKAAIEAYRKVMREALSQRSLHEFFDIR